MPFFCCSAKQPDSPRKSKEAPKEGPKKHKKLNPFDSVFLQNPLAPSDSGLLKYEQQLKNKILGTPLSLQSRAIELIEGKGSTRTFESLEKNYEERYILNEFSAFMLMLAIEEKCNLVPVKTVRPTQEVLDLLTNLFNNYILDSSNEPININYETKEKVMLRWNVESNTLNIKTVEEVEFVLKSLYREVLDINLKLNKK